MSASPAEPRAPPLLTGERRLRNLRPIAQIAAILLFLAASLFGAAGASAEVGQPSGSSADHSAGERAFRDRFAADGELAAPRAAAQLAAPRPAWASDAADEPERPLAARPAPEGARAAAGDESREGSLIGSLLEWLEAGGHLGVPPPSTAALGR